MFLAFPRLGECVGTSDAENFPCRHPSSSLEHVMLGDVRVEPSHAGAYVRSGSIVGGDVTLDGHGSAATFPVTPVELPNATMSATYDATAKELRIDWSTDVPAASVLVIFSEGYGAWLCHTTGSSYVFPLQVEPPYFETAVQAFAPVELHDTPFGEVRVWRSGEMAGQTGPTTTTR
ncbi:MAG: hypothetical protein NT062_15835 [Proteobacteria bacterium]|nr:hypothetical protein [Pseudomonadota bacterium]